MSNRVSREIRLAERPVGMPTDKTFELAQTDIPDPKDGEVLVRNIWMTVDPYMRGRMIEQESYVPSFQIGKPLEGGAVGQVVESKNKDFAAGDYVSGFAGWREFYISDGSDLTKVDPSVAPIQTFLGTLGMPGMTAYVGLMKIGELKDGETVFVSAAAGAVGAVACQVAKAKGCYVVGSAGSAEKVKWLTEEAGCDAAINYKDYKDAAALSAKLGELFPKGIDVYFENVGGDHLTAALDNMNVNGRLVMCGMISQYNATTPPAGPANLIMTIPRRLKMQGFVVSDHFDMMPQFLDDMGKWIKAGKLKWRETVYDGIENAPKAFLGLFKGENMGKALVKIGPDPAV